MLVPLEHDARRYRLEQVFAKQGFRFGWSKVPHTLPIFARLVLDVLSLACLHVVDEGDRNPVLGCHSLKSHHHSRDRLSSLCEALVAASYMLAEGVHDD